MAEPEPPWGQYDKALKRIHDKLTPPSTLLAGSKTVATAGTAEPLADATPVKNSVLIQAKPENTGNVLIGDSTSQDVTLEPGDAVVAVIDDLSKIHIKVTVAGEGVNYLGG